MGGAFPSEHFLTWSTGLSLTVLSSLIIIAALALTLQF